MKLYINKGQSAILIAAFLLFASSMKAQVTYCAAWGKIQYYEYIDYISFGAITRTSGAEPGGYYDGTALVTDVTPGETYTLTYSHANPVGGYTENWKVFIDWNRDGDFTDAGETVVTSTSYTTVNYANAIIVPVTAATGITRMRVCMESALFPFPSSCGKFQYGEVEDYSLNVVGGVCSESYEPNNSKGTSKPILTNTDIHSQISTATDNDWFSISNTMGEPNIQILLTSLPANYNIRLYDPTGVLIGSSGFSGLANESIIYNTATIGTYKIKVWGAGGAFNSSLCYTLRANTSAIPFRYSVNEMNNEASDISVYPIPAVNILNIEYNCVEDGTATFTIYNSMGEVMYAQQKDVLGGKTAMQMELNNFISGIYYIQILQNDSILRKEFVVVK